MKIIFTVVLSLTVCIVSAQWSNTSNTFTDSLHMPVAIAASSQRNVVVINSYPDGGYILMWEDDRNTATTKTDIYAQKFDINGKRLWAQNGVPIANSPLADHFTFPSNQDYRNRTFAATDSAGGFYMCYASDSVSSYVFEKVTVQHVRSNGTNVFPGGYVLTRSATPNLNTSPQLLADGNKGFFISYRSQYTYVDYVNVYCYSDIGGNLKYYGGGRVNENAIQVSAIAPCGIKTDVLNPGTSVIDYNIWSDGDRGCNVVVSMNGNTGEQGNMLVYNRLFRVKKDCQVKTYFRNTVGMACPTTTQYQKDDVSLLYYIRKDYQSVFCTSADGKTAYSYTNYRLLSNGYALLDINGYDYNYPKGVTINTSGNIFTNMVAVTTRSLNNNSVTPFIVKGIAFASEKYDSVPYQRASYDNPDIGYNPTPPYGLNTINNFRDTLLGSATYYVDFSLAGGGSHIYATALMGNSGTRIVRLQNLEVSNKTTDSFAIEYKTNILSTPEKSGAAIGSELSTGFGGTDISYDMPLINITQSGKALFYIREYYRSARVSPIGSGAQLSWGAMGRPISAGVYNNSFYNLEQPFAVQDTSGSAAVIAWRDDKYMNDNTGDNIFMRHLDKFAVNNYTPPINPPKALYSGSGEFPANPSVFLGSSKVYSDIDVYNSSTTATTTVAQIMDNNNLGNLVTHVYQQLGAARTYSGDAYLGRNYTFKPDSIPSSASFDMLFYFTNDEFAALKAADNTITDPGFLTITRQPNTTATAPAAYTPVSGEEILTPVTWDSTAGGYYIRVKSKGLGNFFIRKLQSSTLCSGGSTTFSSNVTGSSYQWQVSTGGVYTNVANGGNYAGASTATLQVNNVSSSFNANRYRCVIDNINVSNAYFLKVGNTWTGAVNNQWETAGNWSCGSVPDANTNVFISSGTITVNSNATCRSLTVATGVNVTVQPGFSLNVMH